MKRSFLSIAMVILVTFQAAPSQNKPDGNFLLKRFESDIAFDYLQEFSTSFLIYVEKMGSRGRSKAAIRFCSEDPMKIAVTKGAIDLSTIYNVFKGYGFVDKDVIILRSKECVSKENPISATEIWVINDENDLPPFSERRYSNEIKSVEIGGSVVRFIGKSPYLNNAKALARELAKNESGFGVVYIAYTGSNKIVTDSFRKKIVNVFTHARIDQSRYSLKVIRWNRKLSVEPLGKQVLLPDFFLVTTNANWVN